MGVLFLLMVIAPIVDLALGSAWAPFYFRIGIPVNRLGEIEFNQLLCEFRRCVAQNQDRCFQTGPA